jgi:uncharacterized membrane protein
MKMKNLAKLISKLLLVAAFSVVSTLVNAQEVEMADAMRANGKIYVLLAIIVVILAGVLAYLISLDRKISKVEQALPQKK